jgi:hypothetical protein
MEALAASIDDGFGFDDSFRIEHDDVFDRLLTGPVGPEAGERE